MHLKSTTKGGWCRWLASLALAAAIAVPLQAREKAYPGQPAEDGSRARPTHLFRSTPSAVGLNYVSTPTVALPATGSARRVAGAPSRVSVAGYLTGSDKHQNGIWSFDVGSAPSLSLLFHDPEQRLAADGGGTYYDGRYYYVEWHYGMMSDDIYAHYGIVETDTWTELYRSAMDNNPIDEHSIALDLTYCPLDKTIYGVFEDYNVMTDSYDFYFGRLDQYGQRVGIARLDKRYWAVAANAAGEVYAIDEDGKLCRLDRFTGAVTVVGSTGITPYYMQSACFDFRSGTMYWVASGKSILTALYTVDTSTGAVSKVCDIPDGEAMLGIYVVDHNFADGAPFKPTNLTTTFTGASLSGTVNFTMPDATYAGEPLSGTLNYTVTANGQQVATGTAQAGQGVNAQVTVAAPAMYEIAVNASNAAGDGPAVKTSLWIGADTPKGPTAVKATVADGKTAISWQAPEATVNGGYLDPTTLRYKVVRFPDMYVVAENLVATSVDDVNNGVPIKTYWYEVTACAGSKAGGSALSNNVVFGTHYEVPYTEDFATDATWNLFSKFDVNDDGKEWLYYSDKQAAGCAAPGARDNGDDWLITAPIYLTADRSYILSFDMRGMSDTYVETFDVAFGTAPTPAGMQNMILPGQEVKSSQNVNFSTEFSVTADGLYYIGFHATSPKYRMWIFLDNISLVAGATLGAPAEITDLTVEPAEIGDMLATLRFTAPSKTAAGTALDAIEAIEIYSGISKVAELKGIAPGQKVEWEDEEPQQGINEYMVAARNSAGLGKPAYASAWVGIDVPVPVTDLTAVDDGEGHFTISWKAPTAGVHGGFIDPSGVRYYVMRTTDDYPFAQNLSATNIIDLDAGKAHQVLAYGVTAVSEGGQSEWALSNLVATGRPHSLPYKESFAGKAVTNGPWAVLTTAGEGEWEMKGGSFRPFTQGVQDNDGGMIVFVPQQAGDAGRLESGKFDITPTVKPALSFWYFNNPGENGSITVEISRNGAAFEPVKTIDFSTASGSKEFVNELIDLTPYQQGSKYIRVAFVATAASDNEICIDNIRLFDNIDQDLAAVSIETPSRMSFGEHSLIHVKVRNIGQQPAGAFAVNLLRDGSVVDTRQISDALAPDAETTVSFEQVPTAEFGTKALYKAVIEYAADQNTLNNSTDEVAVVVKQPNLPAPADFTLAAGAEENTALLSWSAPDLDNAEGTLTTEDFEDYTPFTIGNFGDWLNLDRDGYETVGVGYGSYPNRFDPKPWMVFNPVEAGLSVAYDDGTPNTFAPASGSQYLAAFCSTDSYQEDQPNDDWLISPRLTGKAQTITFKVKRLGLDYAESYEVLASEASDSYADFTPVASGSSNILFDEWTTVSVNLPAGTRYFAIRCNSYGGLCLQLDDITYTPAADIPADLALVGYNVYCDDTKVNAEPLTATTYTHAYDPASGHTYHVTALYNLGESTPSERLTIGQTGLESVEAAGKPIVTAGPGTITVTNAMGHAVTIHTTDGRLVAAVPSAAASLHLHVAPGVYLVTVGSSTTKLLVP